MIILLLIARSSASSPYITLQHKNHAKTVRNGPDRFSIFGVPRSRDARMKAKREKDRGGEREHREIKISAHVSHTRDSQQPNSNNLEASGWRRNSLRIWDCLSARLISDKMAGAITRNRAPDFQMGHSIRSTVIFGGVASRCVVVVVAVVVAVTRAHECLSPFYPSIPWNFQLWRPPALHTSDNVLFIDSVSASSSRYDWR